MELNEKLKSSRNTIKLNGLPKNENGARLYRAELNRIELKE